MNIAVKEKEEILQKFQTSMDAESAKSQGLFTNHVKAMTAKDYVIAECTVEIRRQLRRFICTNDTGKFQWTQRNGHHYYDFVGLEGDSHSLSFHFDNQTRIMRLYLDQKIIRTDQLDRTIKTTLELELYTELWLLQYLKDTKIKDSIE